MSKAIQQVKPDPYARIVDILAHLNGCDECFHTFTKIAKHSGAKSE